MSNKNKVNRQSDVSKLNYADAVAIKADLKNELKSDVKNEIRRWILHWIWVPVTIAISVLGFFGWSSYKGIQEMQSIILAKATSDFDRKVHERMSEANFSNRVDQILDAKVSDYVTKKLYPLNQKADALQVQLANIDPANHVIRDAVVNVRIDRTNDGGGHGRNLQGLIGSRGVAFLKAEKTLLRVVGPKNGSLSENKTFGFTANEIDGNQTVAALNQADTLIVWCTNMWTMDLTGVTGGLVSCSFNGQFHGEYTVAPQAANSCIVISLTNRPVVVPF